MNIMIKGMEMPSNCDACPMRQINLARCQLLGKSTSHYPNGKEIKGKPNDCPLIEIVECKDCKYRVERYGVGDHRRCELRAGTTRPDDFCSDGERRPDEADT